MNNDILPPPPRPTPPAKKPDGTVSQSTSFPVESNSAPVVSAPLKGSPTSGVTVDTPLPKRKYLKRIIFSIVGILVLALIGVLAWYILSLRPIATGDVQNVRVTITQNSSPSQIGQLLKEKKVIRSATAFDVYTRIHRVHNKLQAGTFKLSPAESTSAIVKHLIYGATDEYTVTFYPGATLNIASTSSDKTPSHRQVLEKLGFETAEIDAAFSADYIKDYPVLFAGKPASADLEGYIYGETYQMASGSSVKQILMRTFAEYEAQIKAKDLVAKFEQQNLTLYQGITLASIIQREVPTENDQRQVAQIFFTRLADGMMLGSDVTYHYAADKLGVTRDHTLDSPYNTRAHTGLPPGPIASPGISALMAVAAPAEGDYVYFLSGDDNKTYFAHTNEEHEANIANHCAYKCSLP